MLKLTEIIKELDLQVLTGKKELDREVSTGYCSDLLSDYMANGPSGCLWITLQTHINVVAVALLTGAAGVVITGGREVPQDVCKKAEAEGLPLLSTAKNAFETAGRLYHLLNKDTV